MKKLLKVLIIAMVMLVPFTVASAKKTTTTTEAIPKDGTPVKLYVFYGSTCSHCADLHAYLSDLETDKDYNYMFEVVDYEVWSDKTNSTLMSNVAKALNTTASGVPFYVVGDYYASGFPNISSTDEETQAYVKETTDALKAAIKKSYIALNKNDNTYVDIVASVGTGNSTVNDASAKKSNDVVGYILLGITVIVVLCIVFGRNSTKEDFEEDIKNALEETKEEVVEEKPAKKVAKKTTTKKAATKKTTIKKATTAKKTTSKKSTSKTTSKKK